MTDTTPILEMPYILPSQAQKHVTHNEALQRLDAVTQLVITARLAAPPPGPAEGACYEVAPTPVGASAGDWAGKAGRIAVWQDGAWTFIVPRSGWRAVFAGDGRLRVHDGTAFKLYDAVAGLDRLGINATADAVNRLAVASSASLFSHAGQGHQVKVNKATPGDTASLLFQSGWSGRAEMGLNGSDAFGVKVSADGSSWQEALRMDASGRVFSPQRPLAYATSALATLTPADGSQTGFSTLALAQGGFALGAAAAGGGSTLVVPATAIYLVSLRVDVDPSTAFSVAVQVNAGKRLATVRSTTGAAARFGPLGLSLAALTAGDSLTLVHTGNVPITFGPDRTEVMIAML
jgi:hypothetical protein